MKIGSDTLRKIIREELVRHIGQLREAPDVQDGEDADKDKDKAQAKQGIPKGKAVDKVPKVKKPPEIEKPERHADKPENQPKDQKAKGSEPPELEKDPADAELAAAEPEGEPDKKGRPLSDMLADKTIQSMTMEPESKILPGAQEIVITFSNTPEPLRILVTKSGLAKFWFKNQLHNRT